MQYQRMRQEYIAGFAGHFIHAHLYSAGDLGSIFHEALNAASFFVPRTESLHPRVRANQALASVGRRQVFDSPLAREILHQLVRTGDEKCSASSRRQLGQAREDTHAGKAQ